MSASEQCQRSIEAYLRGMSRCVPPDRRGHGVCVAVSWSNSSTVIASQRPERSWCQTPATIPSMSSTGKFPTWPLGVSERVPFATRVSDWWIAHFPSGFVSYRDFDDSTIPHATLDTSATAIVGVRDRTQVALKAREPGLL